MQIPMIHDNEIIQVRRNSQSHVWYPAGIIKSRGIEQLNREYGWAKYRLAPGSSR
jgi:hypothetical protein